MAELTRDVMSYLDSVVGYVAPALIDRSCDTAIKRAFISAVELRQRDRKNVYRECEDLLRARDIILENIEEYEEELKQLDLGIPPEKNATSIACMTQNRLTSDEYLTACQITLQAKIERDRAKMELLERALDKVKNDRYYRAFELKYFHGLSNKEIAMEMNDDVINVGIKIYEILKRIAWKVYSIEAL